jgi:hypothetical protein
MGDPASDFNSLVGPYTIGGGIYDFSGTQENHVYHENQGPANSMKTGVSKAEIADWTRLWWDGQSDAWTTDAQFDVSRKDESNPFKLVIGGIDYRIMRRAAFGEGDQQHVIFGRSKDKESKTGCVIAHSDYTVCAGIYDEEANQKDGPLSLQMQQLMQAYKGSGF